MMLERKRSIKATIYYSCLYLSELASFQSRGYIHFIISATILIGYDRYQCSSSVYVTLRRVEYITHGKQGNHVLV